MRSPGTSPVILGVEYEAPRAYNLLRRDGVYAYNKKGSFVSLLPFGLKLCAMIPRRTRQDGILGSQPAT